VDFDALLRDLMHIGVGMLVAWSLTGVVGVVSEQLVLDSQATLRFLLAILVVVFARRTYWEIREWRWRKVSPDDRYGFSSPL
jgi:ABC-type microcin C transport system permease subunit YejB